MKKYWTHSLVKEECNVMESGNFTVYECTGRVTKTKKNLQEKGDWFKSMKVSTRRSLQHLYEHPLNTCSTTFCNTLQTIVFKFEKFSMALEVFNMNTACNTYASFLSHKIFLSLC